MRPPLAASLAALALLPIGCLRVPDPPRDASPPAPEDAHAPPPPLEVTGLSIESLRGDAWPPEAIPRRPAVIVRTSAPLADPEDILLLRGPPDDALLDDLGASPLRVATLARAIPSARRPEVDRVTLTPAEGLAPGEALTIAVVAWARTEDGRRLGSAFAAPLTVSRSPDAGASLIGSWPPDGAASVPASLTAIHARFDGPVEAALVVEVAGAVVEGRSRPSDCGAIGWPGGACLAWTPSRPLSPGAAHAVRLAEGAVDATGAPIDPAPLRFSTALGPDLAPPALSEPACPIDGVILEGGVCAVADDRRVTLTALAGEPVLAILEAGGRSARDVAPRGELRLSLDALPADARFEGRLRVTDLAGQTTTLALPLATAPPLATLSIAEVRADPHGREPSQELVEVLNFGPVPVDLAGLALSDRPDTVGDVIARSQLLAPGERALLVGDDFDPDDLADVPVPPGVALVRVGRSIASGGLSNAGEALYLRDEALRRVSAAPALPAEEGSCLVRVDAARPRTDDADAFAVGPCTPGDAP